MLCCCWEKIYFNDEHSDRVPWYQVTTAHGQGEAGSHIYIRFVKILWEPSFTLQWLRDNILEIFDIISHESQLREKSFSDKSCEPLVSHVNPIFSNFLRQAPFNQNMLILWHLCTEECGGWLGIMGKIAKIASPCLLVQLSGLCFIIISLIKKMAQSALWFSLNLHNFVSLLNYCRVGSFNLWPFTGVIFYFNIQHIYNFVTLIETIDWSNYLNHQLYVSNTYWTQFIMNTINISFSNH